MIFYPKRKPKFGVEAEIRNAVPPTWTLQPGYPQEGFESWSVRLPDVSYGDPSYEILARPDGSLVIVHYGGGTLGATSRRVHLQKAIVLYRESFQSIKLSELLRMIFNDPATPPNRWGLT